MAKSGLAALFNAPKTPLELRAVPLPVPGPGELLVRVTCCTLCGSDLHTYTGRRTTPTPTILGHEMLGEVAALGPGDPVCDLSGRPVALGARVTWSIAANCGACFYCTHGIPQKCGRLFKYGHEAMTAEHPLSGGLAEYCHLAPGTAVVRVSDEVADTVASPANCATATVAAALRTGGGCGDEAVLVQGAGMLGLTACAMARAQGAREVIACDVDPARLAGAERFGATQCVLADGQDAVAEAVRSVTDGRGADLAIELSGAAAAMAAGPALLRIGGRYVLVGAVFPGPAMTVSPEFVIRRLLSIHGLHNYTPADLAEAVAFLEANHARYPWAELVARAFPLAEAEDAFQYALESHALRVAVRPATSS